MLVALGAVAIAAAALTWGLGLASDSPRATIHCAKCRHEFKVSADEYRRAGERPACPQCGGENLEPVMAVCPHCNKGIRHSDVQQGSNEQTQRLCPFCKKPVPAGE